MKNKVILVTTDQFGKGDAELGKVVMENFFTLLKQREELPHAIFFMNHGVNLLTESSLVSVHLKELAEKDVSLLACKTCVDFYKIEQKMTTGVISGMSDFVELASQYEIITIA
ncbi:transcriptional regulator [Ammoniphilus oxalaticus]|uniref:Transcriptional regulator n=1 Tax=Ammoniphilus oxalaticus TaxID=66863 RepID=A0A419SF27_9BACL|nr:DsrE family protein [Ammoniphilus oxalaticus]RKD22061.1 transcriptional regulator [Ammoniphilus oxalaticus]